jgi:hypothetical protein
MPAQSGGIPELCAVAYDQHRAGGSAMNRVLSLYFDGAIVQAITVRIVDGSAFAEEARTFPLEELSEFIAISQKKSCVVCSNPQQFFQDIFHLPPAAVRHYGKLVQGKVARAHPELTSFSSIYHIIGDITLEGKPFNKVAVFSYADAFLSGLVSELSSAGMAVSAVYAAPYVIQRLALSTCPDDPELPRIFISLLQGEKFILVSDNGELVFVRKIPSQNETLLPDDASNINMTVDYCLQTLRIRPAEAITLNQPQLSPDLSQFVSIPLKAALPPGLSELPAHIVQDYLAPVAAALLVVKAPRTGNILPAAYGQAAVHKNMIAGVTAVTAALVLVFSMLFVKEYLAVSQLKSSIGRAKAALGSSSQELATFRKLETEVGRLKQPLELVNKYNSLPNPSAALAALYLPVSRDYQIKGVAVHSVEGGLSIQIEGTLNGAGFSNTQALYEKLVAQVAQLPGLVAVSGKVDINQKTVSIQARYAGKGPKNR